MAIVAGAEVSAHRRDEYLQAVRIAIDPGAVHFELDLTPGIELAEAILADIDRNGDGALSQEEQRAYGSLVLSALTLEADGTPVRAQLGDTSFPDPEAVRRGEGTIRIQSAATLPRRSIGVHQLLFRNGHHPDRSVYLANALVPESDRVAVTAQRRASDQSELIIDYVMRAAPMTSVLVSLLGSIAVTTVLSALLMRARGRRTRAHPSTSQPADSESRHRCAAPRRAAAAR
jgi:hypothetical protein